MTTPSDPFPTDPPGGGYGASTPEYGQPGYGQPTYATPAVSPFGLPGGPVLAGWWSRVGAFFLDGMVAGAAALPLFAVALIAADEAGTPNAAFLVLGYLAYIGVFFWQLVVQGRTGQTLGKRALGIRVLREADGQVIGAGSSIGRSFLHIVDSLPCYVGYLWPLWDAKKQTFADKIIRSVVIKA